MKTQGLFQTRQIVKPVLFTLLFALVFAVYTSPAGAQTIDPSTLQIGPGTGLDPVQLSFSNFVQVTNVSNGASDLNVPWLLILGIPNVTTTTAKITSVNGSPTTITANAQPSATMVAGQEAYSQLGLNAGTNNSNSFTNWAGADLTINGITATSFGLFVYNIPVTLTGGGTDSFNFANLPVGTFIIAYGTTTNGTTTKVFDTPFTEAGLTVRGTPPVPEPNSLFLFGVGILALGLVMRRRLLPGDDSGRMSVA